ncbi:hypothetical protein AB6F55_17085 [Providencia hangzhouensis]
MKYKMSVFILCSLAFSSIANSTIGQQGWVNLKPMKEIKSVSDSSKTEQQNINIEQMTGDKKEGEATGGYESFNTKKNELLSEIFRSGQNSMALILFGIAQRNRQFQ